MKNKEEIKKELDLYTNLAKAVKEGLVVSMFLDIVAYMVEETDDGKKSFEKIDKLYNDAKNELEKVNLNNIEIRDSDKLVESFKEQLNTYERRFSECIGSIKVTQWILGEEEKTKEDE